MDLEKFPSPNSRQTMMMILIWASNRPGDPNYRLRPNIQTRIYTLKKNNNKTKTKRQQTNRKQQIVCLRVRVSFRFHLVEWFIAVKFQIVSTIMPAYGWLLSSQWSGRHFLVCYELHKNIHHCPLPQPFQQPDNLLSHPIAYQWLPFLLLGLHLFSKWYLLLLRWRVGYGSGLTLAVGFSVLRERGNVYITWFW